MIKKWEIRRKRINCLVEGESGAQLRNFISGSGDCMSLGAIRKPGNKEWLKTKETDHQEDK